MRPDRTRRRRTRKVVRPGGMAAVAIVTPEHYSIGVFGLAEKLDLHGPFWDWAGGLEWTAHLQPAGETPRQGQADQGGPDTRATR
ncbi:MULTISPECIES: hypothetical protein [Streptomyces]|uniref:hypothetical protein n=1 Tax=Streptomyces TaxID=1883 RepID=UPI000A5E35B3|nr:hypothetical protein [Streptomyces sp. CB03578]